MKRASRITLFIGICSLAGAVFVSADLLLNDYEGGGAFTGAVGPSNNGLSGNDIGGTNAAFDAGTTLTVRWATLWSGGSTFGSVTDLTGNDTYSFDIRVGVGQPVESGSSYYAQLNDGGGGYLEQYVGQDLVAADGNWYRVRLPISGMNNVSAPNPAALTNMVGVTLGMTYDSDGDDYLYKEVDIDNVRVTSEGVSGITVTQIPEPVTIVIFGLGGGLVAMLRRRRC
jgi:hypothetical protein